MWFRPSKSQIDLLLRLSDRQLPAETDLEQLQELTGLPNLSFKDAVALIKALMLEVLDFHNADGDGVQVVEAAAATPPRMKGKRHLKRQKRNWTMTPIHQATQWISGAAALNVKLTEYIKEASKATKLPGSTGKAYKTSFEGHQKSLMEIREKLEKNMTSKKQLKIEMVAATCLVETMKDDLHAFSTLFRSYYGRKPEDKAKA
jgi:hypothetical protein